jgi:O-antigen/teichoic acid export membrane protein
MGSLLALSAFIDLGYPTIIAQFASHEYAFLKIESKSISGEGSALNRLACLFRFCIKWTIFAVAIGFPVIFGIGVYLFSSQTSSVSWELPWLIFVITYAFNFIGTIFLNFVESLNRVSEIERIKLIGTIVQAIATSIPLLFNFTLFALGIGMFFSFIAEQALLLKRYGPIFSQLLYLSRNKSYNWNSRFYPLLKRYALSWSSNYLIFNIYVPLMFEFHGSVAAGKLGISLMAFSALYSVANSWISSIIPRMNIFISLKEWKKLDDRFKKNFLLAFLTYACGVFGFFIIRDILFNHLAIFNRFSDNTTLIIIAVIYLLLVIFFSFSSYLRAHQQEPFAVLNLVDSFYALFITIIVGIFLPVQLFLIGFLSYFFWALPIATYIFMAKRKAWHKKEDP